MRTQPCLARYVTRHRFAALSAKFSGGLGTHPVELGDLVVLGFADRRTHDLDKVLVSVPPVELVLAELHSD